MTAPDEHSFEQQMHGKNAAEIEGKAKAAVEAYFGDLADVEWTVDTDAQVNLAGGVMGYVAKVQAHRRADR